jgi:3-deoxy-D-manno-octulosonate 8-phosphate phosphatase (KDO 8-P phosphatase)
MIKLIVFDVDGTLTDGKLYIDNFGNEMKSFDVKDGLAIAQAIKFGIKVAFLTGKSSKIVERRGSELGVQEIRQGISNKVKELEEILEKYSITYQETAYMGDDLIDLEVMKRVGLAGAPADAVEEILEISTFVSKKAGGAGAAREFVEKILKEQGHWEKIVKNFENRAQ